MKKLLIINILLCILTAALISCSEKDSSENNIKPTESSVTAPAVTTVAEEKTTLQATLVSAENSTSSEAHSVNVTDLQNVGRLSLGGSHTGFVTEDGSLYMWGANDSGQLGNGEEGYKAFSAVPIKIMDNVETVSLGNGHSGALTKDSKLYMWGNNRLNGVGEIETDNGLVLVPTKIDITGN